MRQLRILHGPFEVAGVGGALVSALRRRGHDAELVVMVDAPFGLPTDRVVRGYPARALEGVRAPLRHDVLHFHFNTTFCEYIDAAWARIAGRPTMIMHFHGDDCRRREVTFAQHPGRARVYDATPRNERLTLRRTRLAGRLCHAAVVADLELLAHVRPFFGTVYVVPAPLTLPTTAPPPLPSGEPPTVFHAPSHPTVKGTAMIEAAIEQVSRRRPLRPRLVTGVSHERVLEEIARADIVIDQMNSETPGIFALEAMALGRPVLCEYRREMLGSFAQRTPLVAVAPETLAQRLDELCSDPGRREAIGRESAEFVAAVHDANRVAAAIEQVYEHARSRARGVFEVTDRGLQAIATS